MAADPSRGPTERPTIERQQPKGAAPVAKTNPTRPTKDPQADCPTVEEYEIRRRERMAALPKR